MTNAVSPDFTAVRPAADAAATPWVFTFDAAAQLPPQELGGKGWSLVHMQAAGLPVPGGFCLGRSAFREFLSANAIELDAVWRSGDEPALAALAGQIRGGTLPPAMRAQVRRAYRWLGGGAVAVRSSAIDEDSAEHSFAGQHTTHLHVRGEVALEACICDVWASLLNPAALAYRRQRGVDRGDGEAPSMAVVVQGMIDADCAGVAFALNPLNGRRDQWLVEACPGLGEGLVAGRVVSDAWTLDAASLEPLHSQVHYKTSALGWSDERAAVVELPLAPGQREAPVLDGQAVQEIARLLQSCNRRFGAPQDIEWARRDGRLWLLQSRPVTNVAAPEPPPRTPHQGRPSPAVDQGALWSRMDIGEIFTGRMTPLGISFARHYHYRVHRDCGTGIGLLDLGEPDEYMGYLDGHVYLNVAYTAYMLSQSPPGFDQRPFLARFSSEEVDLSGYRNPYGDSHRDARYPRWRTSLYWLGKTVAEVFGARRRARAMVASRHREYERAAVQDLKAMPRERLQQELTHALDYFRAMHVGYLPFYINAFGLYGLLEELCRQWLPGRGIHLQNRLKGDMSKLRTVESARDLQRLAQSLAAYPGLAELFAAQPADRLAEALRAHAQGPRFIAEQLDPFMRENGVRAREEMELTHPRWIDDPAYVFQMVKTYLARGDLLDQRLQLAGGGADAETEALLRELPAGKRFVLKRVIAMYCATSRMREETRMSMITSIWLVRRVLVELARRLVAEGVLRDVAELAWLDFDDLRRYAAGDGDAAAIFRRERIEATRRRQQSYLDHDEPPLTFIGHAPPPQRTTTAPAAAGALQGLGTSRGRVRARARVIHDLVAQAGEMQPGEVIVTRFTDASWTPLFALAAGVVTDIGSMLSHSSIVAREFGIPSVVNTRSATARIRSGDWLLIDGDSGSVSIEGPATAHTTIAATRIEV